MKAHIVVFFFSFRRAEGQGWNEYRGQIQEGKGVR